MVRGKNILVTGGSAGIGRATVEVLARQGANLIVASREDASRDVVPLAEAHGVKCVHVTADVAVEADVERLVTTAIATFGRLDGAFNNASPGGGILKSLSDFTIEDFDTVMANNLRSVWLCMRAEIKAMLAQSPSGGAIVNTASVNGLGAAPFGALYSAAKAGVIALSKAGALDFAAANIRCNALVPGVFRTRMLEGVLQAAAGGDPMVAKQIEHQYEARVPMGRIGRAEEAAEAAAWLLSDAASYVTGASMIVDGGMTSFAR